MIEAFTQSFISELLDKRGSKREQRSRARWLVRVIVSLLAMPGESDAEERQIVERYAIAALVSKDASPGSTQTVS